MQRKNRRERQNYAWLYTVPLAQVLHSLPGPGCLDPPVSLRIHTYSPLKPKSALCCCPCPLSLPGPGC